MIKPWVIKNTTEYRIDTIEEVKQFEQEQRDKAKEECYNLTNFSYAEKFVKAKGEIIDQYYQVKTTIQLNELKDPCFPFHSVEFPQGESAF